MVPRSEDLSTLPQSLRQLLAARGVVGDEELKRFFSPSLAQLAKPEALPGIVEAAKVVAEAIEAGREIVVFGDYDCDGICATAVMVTAVRALGGRATPFLPKRLTEGYGMNAASVSRMLAENPGVGLVVTVDNGINSVEQVAALKARGIAVVVTDHHLPGAELPKADALANPKVASPAELNGLCGAGVAFMLANRLVDDARTRGSYSGPSIGGPLLILAGLATVTDIMPLVNQNRVLVKIALERFRQLAPIGLKELFDRASRSGAQTMTSKDFGFLLGPRINAAGRIADGMEALDLVLSDDREIAREFARIVDGYNVQRKEVEQKMTEVALTKMVAGASAQVIELNGGHPGVVGIVAARIMEKAGGVPTCVVVDGRGSARAPEGVNIRDAMEACSAVLENFGGHAAAGGFTVKPGQVDEFRRLLTEYFDRAKQAEGPAENGGVRVDAWVEPKELTLEFCEWLARIEPFGEGNPEPVFGMKGLMFSEVRPMGMDGKHLSLNFHSRECPRAVWWNRGDLVEKLRADSARPHDLYFTAGISEYGERHVELYVVGLD